MNKKTKKPLLRRICEGLDIPDGTLGTVSGLEAVGNRAVHISGCEGLVSYTDSEVALKLCDGMISILGRELVLRSFSGGRISVYGSIHRICYGKGEDGNDR